MTATTPQSTVLPSFHPNRETCIQDPAQLHTRMVSWGSSFHPPGLNFFIYKVNKHLSNPHQKSASAFNPSSLYSMPNVHFLLGDPMLQALFQMKGITHKQLVRHKIQSCQSKLVNQGRHLSGQIDGLGGGGGCLFVSFSSPGYSDGHSHFVLDHDLASTVQPTSVFVAVPSKSRHKATVL